MIEVMKGALENNVSVAGQMFFSPAALGLG